MISHLDSLMSREGSTGQSKLILVSDLPKTKTSPTFSVAAPQCGSSVRNPMTVINNEGVMH